MVVLERTAPKLPEREAVRIARELYGLTASASALPGEYDDNFRLVTARGEEFVLKVMRPGCSSDLIVLQCKALAHVADRAPSLAIPRVCPTKAGEAIGTAETEDGTSRLVWMLTYVPGRLLAETNPHTPGLLFSLGRFLGEVDLALADFADLAARRELKWDLAHAGWIRDYLRYIPVPARRDLVQRLLEQYQTVAVPTLPTFRTSVIHNDANDYNVLVSASPAGTQRDSQRCQRLQRAGQRLTGRNPAGSQRN